jgi:hypothetical protein
VSDRIFIPWGEWAPDLGGFQNPGLTTAMNVVPVFGQYLPAAPFVRASNTFATSGASGILIHSLGPSSFEIFIGTTTKLYRIDTSGAIPWPLTDYTRLVGGNYAAATTKSYGWQSCNYGENRIFTDYIDDPQVLIPGAVKFEKLATSTFDPKARFVFPIKNNLFLSNCTLAAGYDTLAAGDNPTLVAWSRNDNIRQYGSPNANPEIIGAGFQPLNFDLGSITGGIGGEFGMVSFENGWCRIDGPPFSFQPLVRSTGCNFPNSIVGDGDDIYYWGPSGPAVLRGGVGPAVLLAAGRAIRAMIDNGASGFSSISILGDISPSVPSGKIDPVNKLIYWSYTSKSRQVISGSGQDGDAIICYNIPEDRFSFITGSAASGSLHVGGVVATGQGFDQLKGPWTPGRDLYFIYHDISQIGTVDDFVVRFDPTLSRPANAGSTVLGRAFVQLDAKTTTRVLRVRPIYSTGTKGSLGLTLTVTTKNLPYESGTVTVSSAIDSMGWIVVPGAPLGDFHSFELSMDNGTATLASVTELPGLEVEFVKGSVYAL